MQPLFGRRVLLGISAGIAAYKAAELARLLVKAKVKVKDRDKAKAKDRAGFPSRSSAVRVVAPWRTRKIRVGMIAGLGLF